MADHKEAVRLLIEHRSSLFGFIFSALRNPDAAEEVLQSVAVVVCEKAGEYQSGSNYRAWVREIARRQILQYIRQSNRGPSSISPADLEYLAMAFDEMEKEGSAGDRVQALRDCLNEVSVNMRKLFQLRYESKLTLEQISGQVGIKSEGVRKALYRSRIALRRCIDRRLGVGEQ